ncbi:MAG: NADPH-dependent FMN reductase [Thermomicrobiales bacterium]
MLSIGGSAREVSRTQMAMEAILALASAHDIVPTIATVRDLDLPIYNDDIPLDGQPKSLRRLVEQVREADAYLICSPTYHGSMSSAIKNVLDSLHVRHGQPDAYFQQRPVALASYGGPTAINAVNTLQTVVRVIQGIVVPTVVTVSRDALDVSTGAITDEKALRRADRMLGELARMVAMQRAFYADAGK